MRVRFATNDPTPWPPELPAGENPPPGGIIDYYLPNDASGEVKLEILENGGKVIRRYSSNDPVLSPHPALDSAAYNRVCQQTPTAPFCGLPLYWPGPPMVISTQRGMHRFSWDLHFDPVTAGDTVPNSDDEANGAVPHRTYTTVELAVGAAGQLHGAPNGERPERDAAAHAASRSAREDAAAGLAQLADLSRAPLRCGRRDARRVFCRHGRSSHPRAEGSPLRAQIDSLAPPPARGGGRRGGFGRRGGAGGATPTLNGASDALLAAAMAMQSADVTPTASEVAAAERAQTQANDVMARWNALKNAKSGN